MHLDFLLTNCESILLAKPCAYVLDLGILLNSISREVDYQVVCTFDTCPMPLSSEDLVVHQVVCLEFSSTSPKR